MSPRPPVTDALEAGYRTLESDRASWTAVAGEGPELCAIHGRRHHGFCGECGIEANDAAAAFEGRCRDHGGQLMVDLEAAVTLARHGRAPTAEQIERWSALVRTVRGF